MILQTRQVSKVLLHLSLIKGIGPKNIIKIIDNIKDINVIYNFSALYFMRYCNITSTYAEKIFLGLKDKTVLDKELELINKYNVKWVTIDSNEYPEALKNISVPPIVLYWFGANPNGYTNSISFVGSRKANSYSRHIIKNFIPPLVNLNWSIISGGAIGADTMAHTETIENNGKTCAVLGSGLLKPYPRINIKMFKKIIKAGGTLLSSFPLMSDAVPGNFPARNRIISGISKATCVTQAAVKSGTRITAMYALEEGREVLAVPGPIDDPLSEGCNRLISQGAAVALTHIDILMACGYKVEIKSKNVVYKEKDPILNFCVSAKTFDEIFENDDIKFTFGQLQSRLFDLQLEEKIEQDFSGRWISR